jgi:hypothetical protein
MSDTIAPQFDDLEPEDGSELRADDLRDEVKRLQDEVNTGFPFEVLPDRVQAIIQDAKKFKRYPSDFTASAIIAATATAIGNTFTTEEQPAGFRAVSSVYLCLVGEPGTGKSHPLSFAFNPLQKKDSERFLSWKKDKAERERWERLSKTEKEQQTEPPQPVLKQFILDDTTPEAVLQAHSFNPRGIAIKHDELAGFFKNFERYNKGSEEEMWLSFFSGTPRTVTRKTSDPIRLLKPCITVAGTTQPNVLTSLMQGRKQNGMFQRFLFVYPEGLQMPKWQRERPSTNIDEDWSAILQKLTELPQAVDSFGEPTPFEMPWSNEAADLLLQWQHRFADAGNESDSDTKERFAKLMTYLPRFALVLQLLKYAAQGATKDEVQADSLEGAIQLVNYFNGQAERVSNLIARKDAFRQMKDNEQQLFDTLPEQFTTSEALEAGQALQIPARTVEYWLKEKPYFKRLSQGKYLKQF